MFEYDVIVIGGGTAGLGAYRKAKSLGKKVLIIEKNDFVTTCASVGCMPSKLLIAASENMHEIMKSDKFGINVKEIEIDQKKLLGRVRSERDRFVGFVKRGADNIAAEDKVIGAGYIKNKNTVVVNNREYSTKAIVIATGTNVFIPPVYNDVKDVLLTNENIFEQETLPKSLAVVGAGVIGLELGFALKNLGVEVTLLNTNNNLLGLSQDINDYLVRHLEKELNFTYNDNVISAKKVIGGVELTFESGRTEVFEKILITAGRKTDLKNLGLENAYEENIVGKYNRFTTQLGNSNIFLAGDVNSDVPLLHEATKEGAIAGENAANYPKVKTFQRNVQMSIIFSSPQIIQVGKTKNLPEDVIKGQVSFEDQGRSRVMLKNMGLLNVYFDRKSHRFYGAEMIGPNAENIAHSFAWIIEMGVTLEQVLNFPFYHPVVEEGVRTAFRDALSKI